MADLQKAKLLPVRSGSVPDFIFPLNPSKVTRRRAPQYADIAIAQGDAWQSEVPQLEWVRNPPEDIAIEFMLYAFNMRDHVEQYLDHIDLLMARDSRTGQPPDLVFVNGRSDRVRVVGKDVEEMLWRYDGKVQKAMVKLQFRTLRPRAGR